MKKTVAIIFSSIFALAASVAGAQSYDGAIMASDIKISSRGSELVLEMTLYIKGNAVRASQGIAVVPTLSDAAHEVFFGYVLVNGKERSRIFERQTRFRNAELMENPPLQVMVVDGKQRGQKIDYSSSLAFEPWMTNADLNLRYVLISPAGERQIYTTNVSAITVAGAAEAPQTVAAAVKEPEPVRKPEVALVDTPKPVVAVSPKPEVVTVPESESEAVPEPAIKYEQVVVGEPVAPKPLPEEVVAARPSIDIAPEPVTPAPPAPPAPPTILITPENSTAHTLEGVAYYSSYSRDIAAKAPQIREIAANPKAKITSVSITGYASPDGPEPANSSVAYSRATALSRYLQNEYGIPASLLKVRSEGEDWKGLAEIVAGSTLPYSDRVLEEINGAEPSDVKESKLRRMMGGQIWRTMSNEMFPRLRRVEYKIEYLVAE